MVVSYNLRALLLFFNTCYWVYKFTRDPKLERRFGKPTISTCRFQIFRSRGVKIEKKNEKIEKFKKKIKGLRAYVNYKV